LGWQVYTSLLRCRQFRSPILVSAYLLAASALTPLYGKLSDLIGRKPILYSAIFVFLVSLIRYHCRGPNTANTKSTVGFCPLWCCEKFDLANHMPRGPRHRWGRHPPARSDYCVRHCFSTRAGLIPPRIFFIR
jgi:hypothetical protein